MKDERIPGFAGAHKQHNKEKANKPMAGGKAWPFSKAAKKHGKAGRAMVRATNRLSIRQTLLTQEDTTYLVQYEDNKVWTNLGEFSNQKNCEASIVNWRTNTPKFKYRMVCRLTRVVEYILS